jgi:hypothetical protein
MPATLLVCLAQAIMRTPAAHAQQVPFTLTGSQYGNTVTVTWYDGGSWQNAAVYASPYLATVDGATNVPVFCVDFRHHSYFGQQYLPAVDIAHNVTDQAGGLTQASNGAYYYNGGLASALTNGDYGVTVTTSTASVRASQVAWLADNFLSTTSFSGASGSADLVSNMTALSLTLWDIVQDGGDGLDQGNFRAIGASNSLNRTIADYYLQQASLNSINYTSSTVAWVQAPRTSAFVNQNGNHAQDYLMIQTDSISSIDPVPEPSGIVTGIMMFGTTVLGLVRAKRRRQNLPQPTDS